MPLLDFLQKRIFGPLGMTTVADIDRGAGPADAAGYMRYALGPLRPAPKEGTGWLFAAGELAMTRGRPGAVGHLGDRAGVLKPASYAS